MSDLYEGMYEGEYWRWSCGSCGEVHDEETDIRGETIICVDCDAENKIEGSV